MSFQDTKSGMKKEIMDHCFEYHLKPNQTSRYSEAYFKWKLPGFSGYLGYCNETEIKKLFALRSGTWRWESERRLFQRDVYCNYCASLLTNDHIFDECGRFKRMREDLLRVTKLQNGQFRLLFDLKTRDENFINLCLKIYDSLPKG